VASEPNRSTTGQSVGVEGTAYESNTNSFEALSIIENNNDDPTSGGAKFGSDATATSSMELAGDVHKSTG
jgi:hypothetical protein